MSKPKRYYWLKLKESFMTSDTVDFFMEQEDGANYVVLYQMLCLKTINTGGRMSRQIGELIIPYDVEKIKRDCKWFSVDTIRVALKLYQAVGLIYEDIDGTLVLTDHKNLVGSETDAAARMRDSRENKRTSLPGGVTVGEQEANIVTPEIDIEIRDRDEDRDEDIEGEKKEDEIPADEPPTPLPPPPSDPPDGNGKKDRRKAGIVQPAADYSDTGFSKEMIATVEKWLKYKAERRDVYQPTGLQSLITQIKNNVTKYREPAVIALIEECMAANYKGIIFEKLEKAAKAQPYPGRAGNGTGFQTGNPFLEMRGKG